MKKVLSDISPIILIPTVAPRDLKEQWLDMLKEEENSFFMTPSLQFEAVDRLTQRVQDYGYVEYCHEEGKGLVPLMREYLLPNEIHIE